MGPAHPPGMGPLLPIGVQGLPLLGPGLVAHGLRASAWPQGAGTKVLESRGVATSLEAGGQSPGRVSGVTPWGLLPAWQFPSMRIHADWLGTALRGVYPTLCVGSSPVS